MTYIVDILDILDSKILAFDLIALNVLIINMYDYYRYIGLIISLLSFVLGYKLDECWMVTGKIYLVTTTSIVTFMTTTNIINVYIFDNIIKYMVMSNIFVLIFAGNSLKENLLLLTTCITTPEFKYIDNNIRMTGVIIHKNIWITLYTGVIMYIIKNNNKFFSVKKLHSINTKYLLYSSLILSFIHMNDKWLETRAITLCLITQWGYLYKRLT
jgi:hypothetical protein